MERKFLKMYNVLLSEAMPQQGPPNAAQTAGRDPHGPQDFANDVSIPSPEDANMEQEEKKDVLQENEKFLLDILLKITGVLKDYEIAQHGGSAEITSGIDDLISDTRANIAQGKDLNSILKSFVDRFETTFSAHLQSAPV